MDKCIFCDTKGIKVSLVGARDLHSVECSVCGHYLLSGTAKADHMAQQIPQEDKILFSGYLRNNYIDKNPPEILSSTIMKIPEMVEPYKRLTPMDKVDMLLKYLAKASNFIGQSITLKPEIDYVRFYCKNTTELMRIKEHLWNTGLISMEIPSSDVIVKIEGWKRFESLKEFNINSKKVFVAMSFDADMKELFTKAIFPACEECGFEAFRVDSKEHNEKICDKIIADIKSSRFIIADFTKQKHGVYFEAGFAQGLGLKIIWACKKGEEKNLHFDTRQYNHILWENSEDFKSQLADKIRATIL